MGKAWEMDGNKMKEYEYVGMFERQVSGIRNWWEGVYKIWIKSGIGCVSHRNW